MEKISSLVNSDWIEFSHKPEYNIQDDKLLIGLPNGNVSTFTGFLDLVSEKVFVLYVLHTSRGEGKEGRYQSPLLKKDDAVSFVNKYSEFLACDSRFDIWIHSPKENITIVWDRHNLVHIYGHSKAFLEHLVNNGFIAGDPNIDFNHAHYYRSEFDSQALALLNEYTWSFSELQEADIQLID